jgi:hypothetical protein
MQNSGGSDFHRIAQLSNIPSLFGSGRRARYAYAVRSIRTRVSRMRPTFSRLSFLALFFFGLPSAQGSASPDTGGVPQARINPDSVRLNVIEGDDVRFLRLSGIEGLSQNRVTQIIQDDQGFMWLATQHGVDRYDGYEFKMFKNDPRKANSMCGVFVFSLFKDRSGTLWMGCDSGVDRFDPSTETFVHYSISSGTEPHLPDLVQSRIKSVAASSSPGCSQKSRKASTPDQRLNSILKRLSVAVAADFPLAPVGLGADASSNRTHSSSALRDSAGSPALAEGGLS